MEALLKHDYPGNIRELENAIHWAAAISATDVISPGDLPEGIRPRGHRAKPEITTKPDGRAGRTLDDVAKEAVLECISRHHGNLTKAARELNIGRTTLWRWLKAYKDGVAP